jgi:hypothetical protein
MRSLHYIVILRRTQPMSHVKCASLFLNVRVTVVDNIFIKEKGVEFVLLPPPKQVLDPFLQATNSRERHETKGRLAYYYR